MDTEPSVARTLASPSATPNTPVLAYLQLRAALALFGKPHTALDEAQRQRAMRQAAREYTIECAILASPEAAGVVVAPPQVERAFAEIKQRFEDEAAFHACLADNALDEATLRAALTRQCRVETVLERVTAAVEHMPISDVDISLYYHAHFEQFRQPERREAYHILISINDAFPENTREHARARIEKLAARLDDKPQLFPELAQRHSECPTALHGGRIGFVRRGQLYPQLDDVLFRLPAGRCSAPVESPLGWHVLWCKTILAPHTLSLKRATPHIRKILKERLQEQQRRAWISALIAPTALDGAEP